MGLFNKIKKLFKEKEYKKLTYDPKYQSILKKHNLEPVPYGKDISFIGSYLAVFAKKSV